MSSPDWGLLTGFVCFFVMVFVNLRGSWLTRTDFNEDMIRRTDIPRDAFVLLHDICYHHGNRDVYDYVRRAQEILKKESA